MSAPILIIVAKLPCKMRNRCAGGRDWRATHEANADITNESDQFALPQRSRLHAGGELIDRPRRHSVSGDDPMTGAQAATSTLWKDAEPDSFYPDLTKAKTMPSSRSKDRCNTGNPQ